MPTLEGMQSISRVFIKYVTTLWPLIGFREPWEGDGPQQRETYSLLV
jgi:hypothetical protein